MPKRQIAAALGLTAGLAGAGSLYALQLEVPYGLAALLLPPFVFEVLLYLLSTNARFRDRLSRWRPVQLASAMTLSAAISYPMYAIPTGVYDPLHALAIMAMVAFASFWYVVAPQTTAADLGFLAIMAAPILFKLFQPLYADPAPRVPMHILGIVLWYRTGLLAVLCLRKMDGVGFGLIPRAVDWKIGAREFVFFLPPAALLAYLLQFTGWRDRELSWATAGLTVLTFAITLWGLALAEEFFFRGVLQRTLAENFGSRLMGLLAASILFGLAHIGFREFPNWKMVVLAAVAGIFYGRAYLSAGSIRASMVTHALVVTTWRVFLR